MISFLLKRPIAVIMSFIAIIVLGLVSSNLIPVSLLPDIEIPEMTIQISAPEASVSEMENQYTKKIRRQLLQVSHLENIESTSSNGQAFCRLRFKYGTDISYAFVEVNEKMDALMPSMPRDFERPRIIKSSASDIPVFYMSVSLKDSSITEKKQRFMQLSEFCNQVIRKRIEQLPEVALVDISGLEFPEIRLIANTQKMEALGVSDYDIKKALESNNLTLGNIKVRERQYEFNVKYSSVLRNRRDIEDLTLKVGHRVFKLKELAKVDVTPKMGKGIFLDKSGQSVIMAVIKKSDARMEDLKDKTQTLLSDLEKDYPQLRFQVTRNQTELLDYSISNLKMSLIIGACLAIIIMLLFLKNIKSSILIGISIPVSLLVSMLWFHIFDLSINIISLSGLILGVGMMIDNSIIVIDNINQHSTKDKKSLFLACLDGTQEIIRPLISSVLTTCAVFIPLIFLSGISGALFYDQAIAITIGLLSSLIVSITLIPVLYHLFNKRADNKKPSPNRWMEKIQIYSNIETSYSQCYNWVFKNKILFLCGSLILIAVGFFASMHIQKERFPSLEQKDAILHIDWNRNIGIPENESRINSCLKLVDTITLSAACQIGEQSFVLDKTNSMSTTEASIYFETSSTDSREKAQNILGSWLEKNYPEASFSFSPTASVFEMLFGNTQYPLEVKIWNSKNSIKSEELEQIKADIYKATNLNTLNKVPTQQYYQLTPDFEKLKLYDIPISRLTDVLKKTLNRLTLFSLQQNQNTIPVVLSDNKSNIYNILQNTRISNQSKSSIPLIELVSVNKIAGFKFIYGDKNSTYTLLAYDVDAQDLNKTTESISNVLKKYPDYHAQFAGSIYTNKSLFNELIVVMLVAILLLYFILASQFESVLTPFIVFIEIPIDIAGALLLLWITGNSLNIMSMIGLVVMSGIIINDSILKIDTINRYVNQGIKVTEAIHIAGRKRLKPIIMTSATTILAMVPFLWGSDIGTKLQQPLAIAIIGGMFIGTFVSLFFIPLSYYFITPKNKR